MTDWFGIASPSVPKGTVEPDIAYQCVKGILTIDTNMMGNNPGGGISSKVAALSTCQDVQCHFKLPSGSHTTFYYSNGAVFSPDADGNMALPANMKDNFNVTLASGNVHYYQCGKAGILSHFNQDMQLIAQFGAY